MGCSDSMRLSGSPIYASSKAPASLAAAMMGMGSLWLRACLRAPVICRLLRTHSAILAALLSASCPIWALSVLRVSCLTLKMLTALKAIMANATIRAQVRISRVRSEDSMFSPLSFRDGLLAWWQCSIGVWKNCNTDCLLLESLFVLLWQSHVDGASCRINLNLTLTLVGGILPQLG